MNETVVIFEITHLPQIPRFLDNVTFVDSIINQTKCEVRFINGTDIPTKYQEDLVSLFSHCLLPIGDWSFIDALFTDEVVVYSMYDLIYNYYASENDDRFIISHIGQSHHGRAGWEGKVNLTTGVPISFKQFSGSLVGGYAYYKELSFSIVDLE